MVVGIGLGRDKIVRPQLPIERNPGPCRHQPEIAFKDFPHVGIGLVTHEPDMPDSGHSLKPLHDRCRKDARPRSRIQHGHIAPELFRRKQARHETGCIFPREKLPLRFPASFRHPGKVIVRGLCNGIDHRPFRWELRLPSGAEWQGLAACPPYPFPHSGLAHIHRLSFSKISNPL